MTIITLYTTAGCHLCNLATHLLDELSVHHALLINSTEIGDNDDLVARYGKVIPVIKFEDNTELKWPFTQHDLKTQIKRLKST